MKTSLFSLALAALLLSHGPTVSAQSLFEQGSSLLKGLGSGDAGGAGASLGRDEIAAGLKEALKVGSDTVVSQLGTRDGFNGDPAVRIPLPQTLVVVRQALEPFGMGDLLVDLETRLNRAAEAATPKAKALFVDAISDMTLADARKIYDGPDDAATRYFQSKMSSPLAREWQPVVQDSLADVGALKVYEQAIGEYAKVPFVPDARANLTEHVIEKGLAGLFHYLAKEEAAIRNNPVKRSTELLQKVFGSP